MRTVSQTLIDNLGTVREIGGRVRFRDNRLVFTEISITGLDGVLGNIIYQDSTVYGSGILRIAVAGTTDQQNPLNSEYYLYWQYISNPAGAWTAPWNSLWNGVSVRVAPYSQPSVEGSVVVYHEFTASECDIYKRTFNGTTWSTATKIMDSYGDAANSLAIADTTNCYIKARFLTGLRWTDYFYKQPLSGAGNTELKIHAYGQTTNGPHTRYLDAVQLNGVDYLFFSDYDEGRPVYFTIKNGKPSDTTLVIPLDIVDDLSSFKMGSASIVNGRLFVTGVLARPSGIAMQVYIMGPEHFTMGRDLYIGTKGATAWTYGAYSFPKAGGKMHMINQVLYYVGPGFCYQTPATSLVGVDNASKRLDVTKINDMRLECSANMPGRGSVRIGQDLDSIIRKGADMEMYATINGTEAQLATVTLNHIQDARDVASRERMVSGMSAAINRLSRWVPDANYDYASHTRQQTNPAHLTQLVRVSGEFTGTQDLQTADLNVDGLLYSVARPARGGLVAARFYDTSTTNTTYTYGLILNYRRETTAEATERLGKDDVSDEEFGNSGIYILQETATNRLYIKHVVNNVVVYNYNVALTTPAGVWHWLAASFRDGYVRVYYRHGSDYTWTLVAETHIVGEYDPWPQDGVGRSGLFMRTNTPYSAGYGFHSDATVVPVESNAPFAASGTVRVDSELITYNGKSPNIAAPANLVWQEGYTLEGATHWTGDPPAEFTGSEIYFDGSDVVTARDAYNGMALVITEGPGSGLAFKITDYDYQAPTQWVPSQTYTLPDTWLDHVGEVGHGSWEASNMRRVFVEGNVMALGEDTKASIVPTLYVTARGASGTTKSAHNAQVNTQSTGYVRCDKYEFYSSDREWCLGEMITEVARKAGVLDVQPEIDTGTASITIAAEASAVVSDIENSGIVEITIPVSSAAKFGAIFEYSSQKHFIGVDSGYTYHMAYVSGWNTTQKVPLPFTITAGDVLRIAKYDSFASVWINGQFIWGFANTVSGFTGVKIGYLTSTGNDPQNVSYKVHRLNERVDSFIIDMGQRGFQHIERLVDERRVYFMDTATGGLRAFRTRTAVNPSTPYHLTVEHADISSDGELATRVRVEGADVHEVIDYDAMRQLGNLFAIANLAELTDLRSIQLEASRLLEDALLSGHRAVLSGAVDPRIEPQDIISVELPEGDRDFIVDRAAFIMNTTEHEAVFDMTLEGRYASITY